MKTPAIFSTGEPSYRVPASTSGSARPIRLTTPKVPGGRLFTAATVFDLPLACASQIVVVKGSGSSMTRWAHRPPRHPAHRRVSASAAQHHRKRIAEQLAVAARHEHPSQRPDRRG